LRRGSPSGRRQEYERTYTLTVCRSTSQCFLVRQTGGWELRMTGSSLHPDSQWGKRRHFGKCNYITAGSFHKSVPAYTVTLSFSHSEISFLIALSLISVRDCNRGLHIHSCTHARTPHIHLRACTHTYRHPQRRIFRRALILEADPFLLADLHVCCFLLGVNGMTDRPSAHTHINTHTRT
jgi:hypothetical protein